MAKKKKTQMKDNESSFAQNEATDEVTVESGEDIEIFGEVGEEEVEKEKVAEVTDVAREITKKMEDRIRTIQTELINLNTSLVFAIATCECKMRDRCEVFKYGREIAKVIKKLQDIVKVRPKQK